jgi:hypothetical protein
MCSLALSLSITPGPYRERYDRATSDDDEGKNVNTTWYRLLEMNDGIFYTVDMRFLIAAVVISAVSELLVLALYVGWSQLGRRVSLNPLETAAALGAPLLADANSNADCSRIVAQVGARRVRYTGTGAPAGEPLMPLQPLLGSATAGHGSAEDGEATKSGGGGSAEQDDGAASSFIEGG